MTSYGGICGKERVDLYIYIYIYICHEMCLLFDNIIILFVIKCIIFAYVNIFLCIDVFIL